MKDTILKIEHLTKHYCSRAGKVTAIDDLNFSLEKGEVVGLLGLNGAGKTTTIKCLSGLVIPTTGRIAVGREQLTDRRSRLSRIAAVLEGDRNCYWRLTARENIEFSAGLYGIPRRRIQSLMDELLERLSLEEQANTQVRKLSRGMKQKLAIACSLVKQTDIVLLDEPALGLDIETSHELRLLLREMSKKYGRAILLSSHQMDVVQDVCDRVIVIHEGRKVVDDKISSLLELFKAKSYRIALEGSVSQCQKQQLIEKFEMIQIKNGSDKSIIEVDFVEKTLFDVMDVLRRDADIKIESINRCDPNLEEIYLKLIER